MKDCVDAIETEQRITDLLTEFDEMGFAPSTVCENPEQYAINWRERVRKEFTRLTAENENLQKEIRESKKYIDNMAEYVERLRKLLIFAINNHGGNER